MPTPISANDTRLAGFAAAFGGTSNSAFADFLKIVNGSPKYIQELNAYLVAHPFDSIATANEVIAKSDKTSLPAVAVTDVATRFMTVATSSPTYDKFSTVEPMRDRQ
jgi:hypothetical protein